MSYDTIKNKIKGLIEGLGYAESSRVDGLEQVPATERDSSYVLKFLSGELAQANQRLDDRIRDTQRWQIQVAFNRTELNDIVQRDQTCRARDAIIAKLDNPTNWSGGALIIHYLDGDVTDNKDYFLLTLNFEVIDEITYT